MSLLLSYGKNLSFLTDFFINYVPLYNKFKAINGLSCAHYDMRFIKPLDERLLHSIFKTYPKIITIEDGVIRGGFGSAVLEFAATHHYKNEVIVKGIPDAFIEQGPVGVLQKVLTLDADSLKQYIKSRL